MLRRIVKSGLRLLLGDYECYEIYALPLTGLAQSDLSQWTDQGFEFRTLETEDLTSSPHEDIRARAFYGGAGADGFGVFKDGELISLQWFWHGDRYRQRNFWPLEEDEAKSVELFTLDAHRGRGIATALKAYSAEEMKARGYARLISRIWHSNWPSRRVSEKLGWLNIALVTVIYPFGIKAFKIRRDRHRKVN
jgi:GNAT superfamily N-acetyltransferase